AKGLRLQKAMADAGLGARRDCEDMITAGRVKVNGRVVDTLPCFVDPASDVVELDGEVIELPIPEHGDAAASQANRKSGSSGKARTLIYVLINKPKGVITTTSDPEGRRNVLDLVPISLRREERLF